MKKVLFTILAFCFVAGLLAVTTCDQRKTANIVGKEVNSKGFVVMELFTSQGCSSCPAADELLGSYAEKNDEHIIPIAFHVDYWNQLGWRDSFSNSQNSYRQQYYNEKFLHASVYTPQLIVNGQHEMVGNNETKVATAVKNALNETAVNRLYKAKTSAITS